VNEFLSTLACVSQFLQRERLMDLPDSAMLLTSWPSAFVELQMMFLITCFTQ